jgi:hypothetical protein
VRIIRVVRFINYLIKINMNDQQSVDRQIFTIVLTILTLIYVTSGMMVVFELQIRNQMI